MFRIFRFTLVAIIFAQLPQASAQDLQAVARVDVSRSSLVDFRRGSELTFALSQPIPFRVFSLDNPKRAIIDFKQINWQGFDAAALGTSENITGLRFGLFQPGWSRIVLDLAEPMVISNAEMATDTETGKGVLTLSLSDVDENEFQASLGLANDPDWTLNVPSGKIASKRRQTGEEPIVVVIDPGHGGIDPGAEKSGYLEKDLVLTFAQELHEALIRSGRFKSYLTRTTDVFLPLHDRITIARSHEADVFISLHADALKRGNASGSTVYTLSQKASDGAAELLATQHDRGDLLAGVDLSEQDDEVATLLMDMARVETQARNEMLADMVVSGVAQSIGKLRKSPHLSAGFAVLKAPDIPSILIELGFMSNERDLVNLLTPDWRKKVVKGIILGIDTWAIEDAAQAHLLRQ